MWRKAYKTSRSVELGYPVKDEVDERARSNGTGQRPIFQKLLDIHNYAAKLQLF